MMLRAWSQLAAAVVFSCAALAQSTTSTGFGPLLLSSNPFAGSSNPSQILSYDPIRGGYLGVFAAGANLSQAQGIAFGPDGNLYVASDSANEILKFDGTTGAYIGPFASVQNPVGIVFGADKNLYVVTNNPDSVEKLDGSKGTVLATSLAGPAAPLDGAFGIAFGPDGKYIYVTSTNSGYVVRFNSSTLAYTSPPFITLSGAAGLLFLPSGGDLLVSDLYDPIIFRFDPATGEAKGIFASGSPLVGAGAMALGPNNEVYVANPFAPNVLRYNGSTGALIDVFIPPNAYGPGQVNFLTFAPPLAQPAISANGIVAGIVNAASYVGGQIAPGELITLFGVGMGPLTSSPLTIDSSINGVATYTAGTRVLFNGIPAPVIYAQSNQVSVQVPYALAGSSTAQVQAEYLGQLSTAIKVQVSQTMPGIFTVNSKGYGQGSLINSDGTPNSADSPAAKGSVVSIYATGAGLLNTTVGDGALAANSAITSALQPTVTIGGIQAKVEYSGGSPGNIFGLWQINVRVPANAPSGSEVPVMLTIGGASSKTGVTMCIQ